MLIPFSWAFFIEEVDIMKSLLNFIANKQNRDICLKAPVTGRVIKLVDVSDPAFSQKLLGDGIAIDPQDNHLYAPADGEIKAIFPTGHALGMRLNNNLEIMIHIGIDTVELNGEGFSIKVSDNERVSQGQELVAFDRDFICKRGYDSTVMMIVMNSEEMKKNTLQQVCLSSVQAGDDCLIIEAGQKCQI